MDEETKKTKFFHFWKLLLFSIIWIGMLVKLLFFDWDNYLVTTFLPDYHWLLNYRALLLIFIVGLSSKFKFWMLICNFLLFIFFPFIMLFGIIPTKIFKLSKWSGLISLSSSLILIFRNFRLKLCIFIFYILSFFTIQFSTHHIFLLISIIAISICFALFLFSLIKMAFTKQNLYQAFTNFATKYIAKMENSASQIQLCNENTLKDLSIQRQVEGIILSNRIMLFSAKKIRDYKERSFFVFQEISLFLIIALALIFTFSTINFGLYRMEPSLFMTDKATFIDFIIYTTNIGNTNIIANHDITKILLIFYHGMMTLFLSLLLVLIIKNIRNSQIHEMKSIIEQLEKMASITENGLCSNSPYNNIDDIIDVLVKLESASIGFICKITKCLS